MAHAIVHIGTEKTGSTSIQSFLKRNRRQLEAVGISAPRELAGNNRNRLVVPFSPDTQDLYESLSIHSADDLERNQASLEELFRAPTGTWIVSAEHLSSRLSSASQITSLTNWLGKMFDRVTIVMFIRRQDFWLSSLYANAVRTGVRIPFTMDAFDRRELDLNELVELWSTSNPPEDLIVLPYLERTNSEDLMDRFISAAGIPPNPEFRTGRIRENPRISSDALEVMRLVNNQIGPYSPTPNREKWVTVKKFLKNVDGKEWAVSPDMARAILDTWRPSNSQLMTTLETKTSPQWFDLETWQQWLHWPIAKPQGDKTIDPQRVVEILLAAADHGVFDRGLESDSAKTMALRDRVRRGLRLRRSTALTSERARSSASR